MAEFSTYISNTARRIAQHMEYFPYGETLEEEHKNSNNSPYKFNGKPLDAETGNYYYGARYYNLKWSIWITVDPLTGKYPGWSPDNYVLDNPVMLVDPTGMAPTDHWIISNSGEARLVDTKGDEVWVKSAGAKNYTLISKYDFSQNTGALKTIAKYYGGNQPYIQGVEVYRYPSKKYYLLHHPHAKGVPAAEVRNYSYDSGFNLFGVQLEEPSFSSSDIVLYLYDGKLLSDYFDTKFNFTNTIEHEHKHKMDTHLIDAKLKRGQSVYSTILGSSKKDQRKYFEHRAFKYQKSIDSWECTTKEFKKKVNAYKNTFQ